jgi:hypothetical protein
MTAEWPESDVFAGVREDLAPLADAYGPGTMFLPDGLEELSERPMSNGSIHAVPWEYHVGAPSSRRGGEIRVDIVIRGVTIVHGAGPEATYRRYVDWAGAWAQLGISAGRGELNLPDGIQPPGPQPARQKLLPVDGKFVDVPDDPTQG